MEAQMRRFILLAIAIVVLVLGYAVRTTMFPSSTPASLLTAATPAATLSPHEIHLNYKGIRDLPVHDSTNAN
jgi:flagellar basal body-associated protein FliL